MRQSDIQNLAELYTLLPKEDVSKVLLILNELRHITGCEWYPDMFKEVVEPWGEKQVETKESEANVNSLMF